MRIFMKEKFRNFRTNKSTNFQISKVLKKLLDQDFDVLEEVFAVQTGNDHYEVLIVLKNNVISLHECDQFKLLDKITKILNLCGVHQRCGTVHVFNYDEYLSS